MAEDKVTADLRATCGSYWPGHRSDPALNTKLWTLHEGSGTRQFAQRVRFPAGLFRGTPRVFCALSALDLLSDADYCVELGVRDVTRDAMEVHFETRFHSHVYSAAASWFAWEERACPSDSASSCSADCSKGDATCPAGPVAGPLLLPPRISTGRVRFTSFVHGGPPSCPDATAHAVRTLPLAPGAGAGGRPLVLAAIAGLNARHNGPLSVRVRVRHVSREAFALECLLFTPALVRSVTVAWLCVDAGYAGSAEAPALVRLGHVALDSAALGPAIAGGAGTGAREHVAPVAFAGAPGGAFAAVPETLVCLSALDVPHTTDVRVKAVERERRADGFQLCVGTWCDTTVRRAEAVWLAARSGRQTLARPLPIPMMGHVMGMPMPMPMWGPGFGGWDGSSDEEDGSEDGSSDGSWGEGFDSEGSTERDSSDDECEAPPAKKACTEGASEGHGACSDAGSAAAGSVADSAAAPAPAPAPAPATSPATPASTSAPTSDAGTAGECKICFDAPINTVLLPCGHLCVCLECSKRLTGHSRVCPICRTKIRKVVRTFAA